MARTYSTPKPAPGSIPATGKHRRYVHGEFYCYYDGQFIGAAATAHDADLMLDHHAYEHLTHPIALVARGTDPDRQVV